MMLFSTFCARKVNYDCYWHLCDIESLKAYIATELGLNSFTYYISKKRKLML